MIPRSEPEPDELPWWWCEIHEDDLAGCPCSTGFEEDWADRVSDLVLAWRMGWGPEMVHVVWTRGRRLLRAVDDIETGGLL